MEKSNKYSFHFLFYSYLFFFILFNAELSLIKKVQSLHPWKKKVNDNQENK